MRAGTRGCSSKRRTQLQNDLAVRSNDCNSNAVPDDCELVGNDCNSNGIVDSCDIAGGFSQDSDLDGIPDECFPGLVYCIGDGSGTACPCGNSGPPGKGCANSSGSGAFVNAFGSSSIANDDIVFNATGLLPGSAALLFSGFTQITGGNGNQFGDGLRCVGGQVTRIGLRIPDTQGAASWGAGYAGSLGWASGETRAFQIWYRDTVGSPCGNNFNFSNGLEQTFTP